jgi:hypothetical protein
MSVKGQRARDRRVCAHSKIRKGYYLGLTTEDYVCVVCGKSGSGPEWPKQEQEQEQEQAYANLTNNLALICSPNS